ncbi:hypothetical protein GCM10027578_22320 [Spirosoma luteolum]
MKTTPNNYASNYKRIAHLATDQMKGIHTFLKAETDDFTDWSNVADGADLEDLARTHMAQVDEMIKQVATDPGYSGRKFEGAAYKRTRDLDVKEIAKLMREELAIEFPGCKFSVNIDRYSMGQSIDVRILDVDFDPLHPNLKAALAAGETYQAYINQRSYSFGNVREQSEYNDRYQAFYNKVKRIHKQYNMDDSDSQSDYFHVKYYGQVSNLNIGEYLARQADPDYATKQKAKASADREQDRKEAEARKQKRLEQYGDFQKGQLVYWLPHYDDRKGYFKKNEPVLAKIVTAPTGRGTYGRMGLSRYKLRLFMPVGSPAVKHKAGPIAVKHNGKEYIYYADYDGGTKDNMRSIDAIDKPAPKRAKASLSTIRKRATTKQAATAGRQTTATKKASTAKAKRKPSRETVTATLDTYRTAGRKATAINAKSRLRQETGTTGARRRTAKPAPIAPVVKPAKPKQAVSKPLKAKAKRKPCKTPKQVLDRIDRLESANATLRKALSSDERLIKKVHRQTRR